MFSLSIGAQRWTTLHADWNQFTRSLTSARSIVAAPRTTAGAVRRSSRDRIRVILMLNPGPEPVDYFAEYEVPAFRALSCPNLQRAPAHRLYSNPYLTHTSLGTLVSGTGTASSGRSLRSTLSMHGLSLAGRSSFLTRNRVSKLYPYHSQSFGLPNSITSQLASRALACSYAHDVLVPRACRGETLLLITRQAKQWGISEQHGVIVYARGEARGAHLTPRSRGGEALLRHIPAN